MYWLNKTATSVTRELNLIWRFVKNDIWDTIIPCLIAFVTAWVYAHKGLGQFPLSLLRSTIFTILYILTFCVSNQIDSVEEDRVNKPDRPLVTGLISRQGAFRRLIVYQGLFLLVGLWLQVIWLVISWQIITLFMCQLGASNHWVTKNLVCISFGTITLLAGEWRIASHIDPNVWAYIVVLSLWAGFGLPVQDLRDQQGDKIMKRKTLPLMVGDRNARMYLSIYYLLVSPLVYWVLLLTQVEISETVTNYLILVIVIIETIWHWCVAIRLWLYKSPAQDDTTYHWFVYLFIITIPLICFIRK